MLGKILLFWMISVGESPIQSPLDTVDLQEVAVYAPSLEKYAVGQQVVTFEKELLKKYSGRSLGDLLQQNSGMYMRQYGEGMVASMTMRGTSAGHTAVIWNGLPVNSPSLGQADFSLLPNEAIGEIAVHFGSSGALYGTDAIGGSVHLFSGLKFNKGHELQVTQGLGSFGRVNSGISYGYSTGKLATKTKVYRNASENDFLYQDLTRPGKPDTRVNNAAVSQLGVVQDLGLNIGASSQLSTSVWYSNTDRQIQPLMGSNAHEVQEDGHLRWVMDYHTFFGSNILSFKTGWVKDLMVFDHHSKNMTDQYILSGEYEMNTNGKISSKIGSRYIQIRGDLSTYSTNEKRVELYSSSTYRPFDKLAFSFNFRQAVFNQKWVPFTPAASAEFSLMDKEDQQWKLKAAASKSYKIPTLNDRFWVPGGNPNLRPEQGISWESGMVFRRKFQGNGSIDSEITYFRMDIENWIIWLPQGNVWTPSNLRNVKNQGFELNTKGNFTLGQVEFQARVNYAYNQARNQTRINSNDRSFGKQLPYTPLHKVHWNVNMQRKALAIFIAQVHTGERYDTTDNESIVAPYTLWNAGMDYQWEFSPFSGGLGLQVFNLLDAQYQTMKLRAMPGRNYQINLNINL